MSSSLPPKPTDTELEILGIIWKMGPCSVREVNQEQNAIKDVGYTTTLKIMQIMYEKGLLDRREQGRMHIYHAVVTEEATRLQLLDRFVETAFGGSAMKLVMQALGNTEASSLELDELKKLIQKIEKEQE